MVKRKKKIENKNFLIITLFVVFFIIFVVFINLKPSPSGGLDLKLTEFNQQDFLQIKNTGKVVLTGIDVYVDENKYKTIETKLLPNKTIEDSIPLTSGLHKITVKTPEGASNSINIEG